MNVEDRITKWLPEGRGVWDSITVRQLLTHTSGMPEYTDSLIDLRKDYSEDDLTRLAASRRHGLMDGLGCEPPAGWKIRWLGADVARICYARGTGETERTVATVYYTGDWRVAYFDYESY